MDKTRIEYLFQRYLDDQSTPDEIAALDAALASPENEAIIKELLDKTYAENAKLKTGENIDQQEKERIFNRIISTPQEQVKTRRLLPRIAAAAVVLLALSFGGYKLLHKQVAQQVAQNQIHDIAPGGNKAILTLANGQKISITDAKNGNVAQQANASITKTQNGQLIYLVNKVAASGPANSGATEVAYNTVSTPVTGQHEVTLSDGTEAYLDAQSSITFPVAFTGKERKVSMTGQVYFVVKHNDQQPFLVSVKGQTIRDIGTEFNVNAYDDETAIKTTLVSGSVTVNEHLLKPGEQAINHNNEITVQPADIEAITAWKDGNFIFRHQDLKTTMRQLARWYDVQIVYDNAPENLHIGGKVSRSRPLSVVLAAMQQTGAVKFKTEGRIITVTQ